MDDDNSQMSLTEAMAFLEQAKSMPEDELREVFHNFQHACNSVVKATNSLSPVLGHYIHVQNKPFTDDMAVMMEPAFDLSLTPSTIWKCGRQVGKSFTMAARTIMLSAAIPYFNTLTVTPLFEMTRRFSSNYVNPLIHDSPIKHLMMGSGCDNSVFQKTFLNQSRMFFSFAFLDATRIRGISAARVAIDESQDIDPDFIPIICQTMGRSPWRIRDFSGTPKTVDNTMEIYWQQSSKAEWIIPCGSCKHWNVPLIAVDALKMIGKETLVCAKCSKPVDSNAGRWHHFENTRRNEFVGYHIPQMILPFHYNSPRNWKIIRDAANGAESPAIFYNEIMAEAYDTGEKLVTEQDLRKACTIPRDMNDTKQSKSCVTSYIFRALGVDWGGRGASGLSLTKVAIMGMLPNGRMELIHGENLRNLEDEAAEVVRCIQLFYEYNCNVFCHDASGSGGMRDVLLSTAQFDSSRVFPFVYVRAWANSPITHHPPTELQPRSHYSLDKARSLALMANMIKADWLRFPTWESCNHLIKDFLALIEEKNETKQGGDMYLIVRNASLSDDFAHAVNLACMGSFHTQGRYPDLLERIETAKFQLTKKQLEEVDPQNITEEDWDQSNTIIL